MLFIGIWLWVIRVRTAPESLEHCIFFKKQNLPQLRTDTTQMLRWACGVPHSLDLKMNPPIILYCHCHQGTSGKSSSLGPGRSDDHQANAGVFLLALARAQGPFGRATLTFPCVRLRKTFGLGVPSVFSAHA